MEHKADYDVILPTNLSLRLPNSIPEPDQDTLINDLTIYIFHVIFYVILSGIFGILGTVSNTINIIVFIRQGLFSSNSNVNLFFLAVSDLGVAVTSWFYSIGFSIIVTDIPVVTTWNLPGFMLVTVGRPHAVFVLATRVITAYVTLERFVCVVLPFRVKTWLTPGRSLVFNIAVFVHFIAWIACIYSESWLDFKTQEDTNSSTVLVKIVFTPEFGMIADTYYFVNFLVISFTTVIVSLVCTVITSSHIKISKEWRKATTSIATSSNSAHQRVTNTNNTATPNQKEFSSESTSTSKKGHKMTRKTIDKETRLVKMITTISIVFLICYLPELAFSVLRMVDDRLEESGQFDRVSDVALSVIYFTSAINSSINILVYYSMSGKYRKEFRILFRLSDPNKS